MAALIESWPQPAHRVETAPSYKPGLQFAAITDAGSPLDTLAKESGFRHTFLNPPSIGGRYAALSFFGLVPAALIGVDATLRPGGRDGAGHGA